VSALLSRSPKLAAFDAFAGPPDLLIRFAERVSPSKSLRPASL